MTIKKPCNYFQNRFLKKYCFSDHGQTMVRSAHCGRHKIGFAVQWMVIAWFSWQSCSCNGARMVSLWSGCALFDCFFLVLGWSSWKSCACNGARMVSLWSNCTLLIDSRQACAHNSASMVSLWADFPWLFHLGLWRGGLLGSFLQTKVTSCFSLGWSPWWSWLPSPCCLPMEMQTRFCKRNKLE